MVAGMAVSGSLAPDSFINPSLPLYAMLPLVALQSTAAEAGWIAGPAADPLFAGRVLSALAGALAVLVLGTAVRAVHPRLGAWPAVFLALSPGFVNLCHFATPEPWLLLGTSATLAVALAHVRGSAPAWAVGLLLGLTLSTKYTAAALLVPALLALWLRPPGATEASVSPTPGERFAFVAVGLAMLVLGLALASTPGIALAARLHLRDPRLLHADSALRFVHTLAFMALAAGASLGLPALAAARWSWARRLVRADVLRMLASAAAGFFAGTPYALLRPVSFLSDLAFNQQTRFEYKGLASASTSYGAYLGLLADALTGPLLAAAVLGLLVASARAVRRDAAAGIIVAAALAPYVLVASGGHQALRFLAPTLPPLLWLAAAGIAFVPSPRMRAVGLGFIAARAALGALLVVRLFYVDSRALAGEWLARNVPRGEAIDLIANNPGYAPPAPEGRPFRVVPVLSREMAPSDHFAEAAARYRFEASPWLVLTASYYERFLDHPDQTPERAAFFSELLGGRGGFEPLARFRQRGALRPNAEFLDPEIVVLKKRDDARSR